MTVQRCLKFCGEKQYAGLEYGREVRHAPSPIYHLTIRRRRSCLTRPSAVLVRPELEPPVSKDSRVAMQPWLHREQYSNMRWFFDVGLVMMEASSEHITLMMLGSLTMYNRIPGAKSFAPELTPSHNLPCSISIIGLWLISSLILS